MESIPRTIAKLRRKLNTAVSEINCIRTTGKSALEDREKYLNSFKSMYSSLEKYYSMYEECFDDLAVLSEESASDETISAFTFPSKADNETQTKTRRSYYEVKSMYLTFTSSSTPSSHSTSQLLETTTVVHETSVRLPEIKLTPFNGELLNWPKFRDTYVSIVHDDKTLTPTQKFHYLITSLSGPARSIANKFQISDENYSLCWQAIRDAYDNKRLLASAYLNRVLNFQPLKDKPTVDSLKTFLTSVCDSVSSFELLKIEHESKFILFHLAYRLLDRSTREQFQNAHREFEFPTFEQLFKFIKDRCFSLQLSSNIDNCNVISLSNLSVSRPIEYWEGKQPQEK